MKSFCENYDLRSPIKEPTCFKNLENPSFIDMNLTNKPRRFGTLTMDLSKAFDSLRHDLLKAKLHAYGPGLSYSKLRQGHSWSHRQKAKINSKFSSCKKIHRVQFWVLSCSKSLCVIWFYFHMKPNLLAI